MILIVLNLTFCQDDLPNIPGLTEEVYYKLCGIWSDETNLEFIEDEFSWGKSKYYPDYTLTIDLGEEEPYISVFYILSIEKIDNNQFLFSIADYYEDDEYISSIIIHLNEDGTIWIENIGEYDWFNSDEDLVYYKISGPEKPE